MATSAQRVHVASLHRWLISHEPAVHYKQRRPMVTARWTEQQTADLFTAGGSFEMDCSEAVTFVCRLAGLADPNGLGYNGQGFTGTLLAHLPHYTDPLAAGVGALCVFVSADPNGDHVAQVTEPGHDPLLFSHGGDYGPVAVRLSVELAAQRRIHGHSQAVFLAISKL